MNNLRLFKYISKSFTLIGCDSINQSHVKLYYGKQSFDSVGVKNFFTGKPKNQNISEKNTYSFKLRTTRNYAIAAVITTLGLTWAAVPLYGIFCRMTGYGGTTQHDTDASKLKSMKKYERLITVKFNSDTAANMAWKFKPQQKEVKVTPGETALAFYTATNPTDKPVIGISTYNVIPFEAGPYFNKIQCFCFEEQLLNPHEQVDMPVFFYIDPEFAEDPKMEHVDEIFLSYTFFEAKKNLKLSVPSFFRKS